MFSYVISPPDNSTKTILLGISVMNDTNTINIFLRERPKTFIRFIQSIFTPTLRMFSSDYLPTDYCVNKYVAKEKVRYVKTNDFDHKYHHSSEPGEENVMHYHLKHSKKIMIENLSNMLKNLSTCPGLEELGDQPVLLTHAVRKDILRKFKAYQESKKEYTMESNNENYYKNKLLSMPSIAEQKACLSIPGAIECSDRKPTVNANADLIASNISVALGVVALGLFARGVSQIWQRNSNHVSEEKNSQSIEYRNLRVY